MTNSPFEIPPAIDRHLATLSKLYAKRGASLKQSVIVNAAVSMEEGVSHDNWNGGIDGHDLSLTLPEAIYAEIFDQKDAISEAIKKDLNQVIALDHESLNPFVFGRSRLMTRTGVRNLASWLGRNASCFQRPRHAFGNQTGAFGFSSATGLTSRPKSASYETNWRRLVWPVLSRMQISSPPASGRPRSRMRFFRQTHSLQRYSRISRQRLDR